MEFGSTFVRPHEAEQLRREPHADHGQQRSADRPKASGVWTVVWSFSLSCAVVACDDDARADGDAVEKTDDQEDQTTGGADGG